MRILALAALLACSSTVFAGPQCNEPDRSRWQDKTAFEQRLVEQGYKVKVFKITKGDCYELYGWNPEGKKVEIYYDPVSGSAIKTEVDD